MTKRHLYPNKKPHPLFRDNFMPAKKGFEKPEDVSEFGTVKKDFGHVTKWGDL